MKEYIEREAALKEIENADVMCDIPADAYRVLRRYIERIPASDVVSRDCYDRLLVENDELRKERPVVRCGECKHSAVDYENMRYCKLVTYYNHVPDDWFCSDGERKDGGGE